MLAPPVYDRRRGPSYYMDGYTMIMTDTAAKLVSATSATSATLATSTRQQLLLLWLSGPDLGSNVIAWSTYDGTTPDREADGLPESPPYPSALDAMRDGWRVVGIAPAQTSAAGHESRTAFLLNEIILERLELTHV